MTPAPPASNRGDATVSTPVETCTFVATEKPKIAHLFEVTNLRPSERPFAVAWRGGCRGRVPARAPASPEGDGGVRLGPAPYHFLRACSHIMGADAGKPPRAASRRRGFRGTSL